MAVETEDKLLNLKHNKMLTPMMYVEPLHL